MKIFVPLLLALVVAFPACAVGRPIWVDRPDIEQYAPGRYLTAVGSAALGQDVARARSLAEQAAKKELAAQVRTSIRSYEKTVLTESLALSAGGVEGASTDQLTQSIRQVVDQSLSGIKIVDHFEDRDAGVLYALAAVDLNEQRKQLQQWAAAQDSEIVPLVLKARKAASALAALAFLSKALGKVSAPPPAFYTLQALSPGSASSAGAEYGEREILDLAKDLFAGTGAVRLVEERLKLTGLVPGLAYHMSRVPGDGSTLKLLADRSGTAVAPLPDPLWTDGSGAVLFKLSPASSALPGGILASVVQAAAAREVQLTGQSVLEPVIAGSVFTPNCDGAVRSTIAAAAARCWQQRGWLYLAGDREADASVHFELECDPVKQESGDLFSARIKLVEQREHLEPAIVSYKVTGAADDGAIARMGAAEALAEKICEEKE